MMGGRMKNRREVMRGKEGEDMWIGEI